MEDQSTGGFTILCKYFMKENLLYLQLKISPCYDFISSTNQNLRKMIKIVV